MRCIQVTKNSIQFLTDETSVRNAICASIEKIGKGYELEMVETSFDTKFGTNVVTAARFFIGTNCPPSEKQMIIKEVLNSYNSALKEFTKHKRAYA